MYIKELEALLATYLKKKQELADKKMEDVNTVSQDVISVAKSFKIRTSCVGVDIRITRRSGVRYIQLFTTQRTWKSF
jgi:hypothetical protein